jgi:hypothetical protein
MHYALCTMHYSLCTMHYALCTMHYTLYTIHYTLYTIHYTLYTIHYTLYTIHYTLYTMHYAFCCITMSSNPPSFSPTHSPISYVLFHTPIRSCFHIYIYTYIGLIRQQPSTALTTRRGSSRRSLPTCVARQTNQPSSRLGRLASSV